MIILRSRSLIIPNDEYNLGNDYDTNTATRVFQLDRVMEGIDLANLMFKLDLTYADGTSDTLALDSEVTDDKINLTWTVTKNQLHVPGTVVVQIRALNVDGNMKWTSYIGAFFVEASMFGSADYSGKLTEVEQFEVAIKSEKERVQNEKARQDAEAERVQAEAERKPAEEERKTAEAERKSAETVRSNAETARESAETEREEWYNSAKTNFDAAIASGDKAEKIANSLETNVEANMKAAAASATAAAGSASAAAGSANEAKQYSQNWSALDQRVKKNAADIVTTNNNLGNKAGFRKVILDDTTATDREDLLKKKAKLIYDNQLGDGFYALVGGWAGKGYGFGIAEIASGKIMFLYMLMDTTYKCICDNLPTQSNFVYYQEGIIKAADSFKWNEVEISLPSLAANGGEVFGLTYTIPDSYFENGKWATAAMCGFSLSGNGYTSCTITMCKIIDKNIQYSVKNIGSTALSDIKLKVFIMFART